MTIKPVSHKLASLLLNRCMGDLEAFGIVPSKDDRCLDLYEALERYIRDGLNKVEKTQESVRR